MTQLELHPLFCYLQEIWKLRDQILVAVEFDEMASILFDVHTCFDEFEDFVSNEKIDDQNPYYKSIVGSMVILNKQIADTVQARRLYKAKSIGLSKALATEGSSVNLGRNYKVNYTNHNHDHESNEIFEFFEYVVTKCQVELKSPFTRVFDGLAQPTDFFVAANTLNNCIDSYKTSEAFENTNFVFHEFKNTAQNQIHEKHYEQQLVSDDALLLLRMSSTNRNEDLNSIRSTHFPTPPFKTTNKRGRPSTYIEVIDSDTVEEPTDNSASLYIKQRGPHSKGVKDYLHRWLVRYKDNPYPSREVKEHMARTCGLNVRQDGADFWFST